MEPVTHFLTGACIGRAGLNRKSAYATVAAVLAAEAADIDVLWGFAGPVESLKHHRGITHTFIAAPVVAGVVVGAVWLIDTWRRRRSSGKLQAQAVDMKTARPAERISPDSPEHRGTASVVSQAPQDKDRDSAPVSRQPQPVRWGWLYLAALIASLSHLFLDWTNNYGLRPFFPFNPRWYAGSFVFIAEPVFWALLLLALIAPALTGLIGGEIGARRKPFRGRGWAIFALCGMVLVWCWRWAEHAQATAMVENTQIATAPVTRVALEPYPVNPYRWHALLETAHTFQTAEIDTRTGSIESDPQTDVIYKPASTTATEAAKQTLLGQVYLDWGTWAVVRDLGPQPVPAMEPPRLPPNRVWTTVEFSDLRFNYSFMGTGTPSGHSTLAGWVYVVDDRDEAGEAMGGREQK